MEQNFYFYKVLAKNSWNQKIFFVYFTLNFFPENRKYPQNIREIDLFHFTSFFLWPEVLVFKKYFVKNMCFSSRDIGRLQKKRLDSNYLIYHQWTWITWVRYLPNWSGKLQFLFLFLVIIIFVKMKFEKYNLPKWLGVLVNEWPGTKTRSIMPSNPSLDIHCQIFCHLAIGKKHPLKIYNQFTLNTSWF